MLRLKNILRKKMRNKYVLKGRQEKEDKKNDCKYQLETQRIIEITHF